MCSVNVRWLVTVAKPSIIFWIDASVNSGELPKEILNLMLSGTISTSSNAEHPANVSLKHSVYAPSAALVKSSVLIDFKLVQFLKTAQN